MFTSGTNPRSYSGRRSATTEMRPLPSATPQPRPTELVLSSPASVICSNWSGCIMTVAMARARSVFTQKKMPCPLASTRRSIARMAWSALSPSPARTVSNDSGVAAGPTLSSSRPLSNRTKAGTGSPSTWPTPRSSSGASSASPAPCSPSCANSASNASPVCTSSRVATRTDGAGRASTAISTGAIRCASSMRRRRS